MAKVSKTKKTKASKPLAKTAYGEKRAKSKAILVKQEKFPQSEKPSYRSASSPYSISSKSTAGTLSTASPMSIVLETPIQQKSTSRNGGASSLSLKRSGQKLDISSLGIDGSSKNKVKKTEQAKSNTGRTKSNSGRKKTTNDFGKKDGIIDISADDKDHETNCSNVPALGNDEEDKDNEDKPEELEARQFDWHTSEDLLEGLSFHYDDDAYINKSTGQQIDMLVKKYTLTQLKPVIVLLSFAANINSRDLN
jgi:hypothetical protein